MHLNILSGDDTKDDQKHAAKHMQEDNLSAVHSEQLFSGQGRGLGSDLASTKQYWKLEAEYKTNHIITPLLSSALVNEPVHGWHKYAHCPN